MIYCLFRDVYRLSDIKDETGSLTLSPDMIKFRKGELQVVCDIRYPASLTLAEVRELIKQFGVKYETLNHQPPLMQDKNSPLVRTLLEAYESCTGTAAEPVAIGGGTYARALQSGVAFGPEMPDDEPVVHRADEYITIERVRFLFNVYREAIRRLCVS